MASRHRVSNNRSKKLFSQTADKVKNVNVEPIHMRGGIRL